MTIISALPGGSGDSYMRLVEGLRLEFGIAEVGAIAERIFESEKADFQWEARVAERYLGQHVPIDCCVDDGDCDLSRMAIMSFVAGRWHSGICIVDGEGVAVELLWIRSFDRRSDAVDAFERAR